MLLDGHPNHSGEQICERAKKEGFVRIIEINENKFGEIIMITDECDDMGWLSVQSVFFTNSI